MTAVPEVATTTPSPDIAGERSLAAGGLAALVVLAVALRVVPLILVPSINWGDEIFQTVEPAHRLVYGYGLVTWEFQVGMRSWLLPGAIAGLMEFARLLGDGPAWYLATIALVLGLLASAPVVCAFLWCRRAFGIAGALVAAFAVAVAPELVYFGARTLNEAVAAHLLVIACWLVAPDPPAGGRRRLVAAGALFGLVTLLRLQLAPAVAIVALWPGPEGWRKRLPQLIGGGVMALMAGAAVDWVSLGYPFASLWRNLYYNLYLGISSGFSTEPWVFYLLGELGVWQAAAPLVLLLVGLGAWRKPVLAAAAVAVVLVHSAVPHKEYRFVYAAVLLAMVLAGIGLAQLSLWAASWLERRGVPRRRAVAAGAVLLSAYWALLAYGAWSGATLTALRDRAHDELVAMSFVRGMPGLCGVGLDGKEAWVRYGGYTWLHRPVPMYWLKDDAALAEAAGAFNVLLYDGQPPTRLGFAPERCFGKVCLARRPGWCAPRPMPRMWFPRELRATAPDAGAFEAVPQAGAAAMRP